MSFDIIKDILTVLSTSASTIVLAIGAAILIYGFKVICSKLGISLNDTAMTEILAIVTQVIKYFDQKFVDTIKKNSENGTLTEYQKNIIKEKATDMIISILNSEQMDFLLKKYNMEDIDDVLDILIESTIKDTRTNNNSETIVINETTDEINNSDSEMVACVTYEPTEEELTSIGLCPGNCNSCTLSDECDICRLDKIDKTISF